MLNLNIPDDKLPEELRDESCLDALYSPLRSQSVNPRDYGTKVSFWKNLISLYCVNNGVYSFTLARLKMILTRNGRPPNCLNAVVEELVKSGELQHIEDYLKSSETWGVWATDLVKKPLSWSFNAVKKSLFTSQINPDQVYVHLDVIRSEAERIFLEFDSKHRNKLMNFLQFLKLIGRDTNQAESVKLLLHYLVRQKKADTKATNDKNLESLLIKIGHIDKKVQITEVDLAVYTLEQNEKLFTKCIEDLEDEIALCLKQVKAHLVKGHRQLAKTCLKKKHEIEKRLTHKTNALNNVQVLLERIKDVHGDAEVWESYKKALSAFNSTVTETGLTEDAVEDTMLKLGEMLDIHKDIQSAISRPVEDEDIDLEEELAELMNNGKPDEGSPEIDKLDEEMAKLDLSNLPHVPSGDVSVPEAVNH